MEQNLILILTIVDNKLGVYLADTGGKKKFSLFRGRKFHFSTSFCFQETELNCLKSKILKNYRLPLLIFVTMIFTFIHFRIYSFSMSSILPWWFCFFIEIVWYTTRMIKSWLFLFVFAGTLICLCMFVFEDIQKVNISKN